ncbi:MAG: hypothetical protein ACM3VY_00490, partial [Candidatus Bathyarchaeota archaeon]
MPNPQTADLDDLVVALLAGEIPLPSAHAPWAEVIGRIPARPDLPPSLGQAVLRSDPERMLRRLQLKWAAEYDRYLARLLTGGPEVWIEPEPMPGDPPVDEDALYASLAAHDRA